MPDLESSANIKDFPASVLSENVRWAQRLQQTFPQYFPDPQDKQAPKILWIGCSDSRAHESDATTALPGTVFVHRNIANQFHLNDDNALSVLAFAVRALGIQHIAVVGHKHCGSAVTALREARRPPYEDKLEHHHTLYDSLYHFVESFHKDKVKVNDVHDKDSKGPNDAITRWLTPLVNRVRELDLPADFPEEEAVKIVLRENVKLQIENIAQLDGWVRQHVEKKPVWVHGWMYDFSTGFIEDLKVTKELGGPA